VKGRERRNENSRHYKITGNNNYIQPRRMRIEWKWRGNKNIKKRHRLPRTTTKHGKHTHTHIDTHKQFEHSSCVVVVVAVLFFPLLFALQSIKRIRNIL